MSLATRCPACHTTFKVVRDQLRLADGWVRCGRCGEVFQAADAMAQWATGPEPEHLTTSNDPVAAASIVPPSGREPVAAAATSAVPEALPSGEALESVQTAPVPSVPLEAPEPELPSTLLPDPIPEPSLAAQRFTWASPAPVPTRPQPWVTAVWGLIAVAGLVGLLVQAAVAWHDEWAQSAPSLRPALEVACVMAECKIEPVRRIDALTVEASQLTQLGGTIYQFSTTVRNRAAVELTVPALDLVLTGSDGQIIGRKVLRWADFGLRTRSMAAQQELTLQTNLNTGSTAVAGFTIELFYP